MSSLLLPVNALQSIGKLDKFFSENKAFFLGSDKRFDVFEARNGSFEFVLREEVLSSFQYAKRKNITHQFLRKCFHLLQASSVKDAVENPQKHGTYLPTYLFWLASKSASFSASDTSDDTAAGSASATSSVFPSDVHSAASSTKQEDLYLKHMPSTTSLLHTVGLAAGHKQEKLPMQARLVLNIPSHSFINSAQLKYVLNVYAPVARHYFKSLSYHFDKEQEATNYINCPGANADGQLDLVIRQISEDQSYRIALKDLYFDELLFSNDIDHLMKSLEEEGDSLVIEGGAIRFLKDLGYLDVPYEQLSSYEHKLTLPLVPDGYPSNNNFHNREALQLRKIVRCNASETAFIPSIESLFENEDSNTCEILRLFRQRPTTLYALSQGAYASWFLEAPVKDLNLAHLSLLNRVQEQQPFTLPATKELISDLHSITGYLLKHSSVAEERLLTLVNQETFEILKKGRETFNSVELDSDVDRRAQMDQLRVDLEVLHVCCRDLPHAEKVKDIRDRLYAKFGFTFAVKHEIAYDPFITACIIAKGLNVLVQVFCFLRKTNTPPSLLSAQHCNALMSKGILPQFITSSLWTIQHCIKAACLPMGFAITSFNVATPFSSGRVHSEDLLLASYLSIPFALNTIVDGPWKLQQNCDRQRLMCNIWQVRAELSNTPQAFAFLNKVMSSIELVEFFDSLLFLLMIDNSFSLFTKGSQARARMQPTSFTHTFLEKLKLSFDAINLISPNQLSFGCSYQALLRQIQHVQYSKEHAVFMLFVANVLLSSILDQTRNALRKGEVSVEHLTSFKNQLLVSERLLYLYEQNWERLIEEGILYFECQYLYDTDSRLMLLASPYYQERLSLAVINWPLTDNKRIFMSACALTSVKEVSAFFAAHKDFFAREERYFEAYVCSGGYALVARETLKDSEFSNALVVAHESAQSDQPQQTQGDFPQSVQANLSRPSQVDVYNSAQVNLSLPAQGCSKYGKRKNVTHWLLSRFLHLLQTTSVKHAVANCKKHGCDLLPYLFWLDVIPKTTTAPVSNAEDYVLSLKHFPSSSSLMYTFLLVSGNSKKFLPMHGRLILSVPKGKVNREQLDYVLNKFVETSYQHFKTLSSSFKESTEPFNFLFSPVNYKGPKLELVFRHVAEDKPYIIKLWNVYFDELLHISNIDQPMQFLEGSATPIMCAQNNILLPQFRYSDSVLEASDVVSCDTLPFGLVVLPNDKLTDPSVYRLVLPCKQIAHDRLHITLEFSGNTYPDQKLSSAQAINSQQAEKMVLSQKNALHFIPSIELQTINRGTSFITTCFHLQPDGLCAISQSDFAAWLLKTPIKEVHFAMQSLLGKVQDGKAFTLPASAQIVSIMQGFMGYLLSIGDTDDAFVAKYLNDSSSLPLLQKARQVLLNIDSLDDLARQMQLDLRALYECSKALSFKEQCADASFLLEQAFNAQFEPQTYNIAYPPRQTAFLMAKFLELLTKVYDFFSGAAINDNSMRQYYDALVCKGSLPFFILQFEVDIPHLNKATCLPVDVVGVTFDKNNHHDGLNYTPAGLWGHDYFFHPYFINTFVDALWKRQQNYERVILMHNIEAVRTQLANNADSFIFVNESINTKQLLQTFDLLIFLLMHETYGVISTHTRARITPFSFPHTFLEKVKAYFSAVDLKFPNKLELKYLFEDFTEEMRALLPLRGNSSFLYFATCLLLDTVVEETRIAMPEQEEVPVVDMITVFKQKLLRQEDLLYLYEDNWERLVSIGVLYKACARITNIDERLRALALPHFQERLRNEIIDWPLDLQAAKQKHERRFARKARMKDCMVM